MRRVVLRPCGRGCGVLLPCRSRPRVCRACTRARHREHHRRQTLGLSQPATELTDAQIEAAYQSALQAIRRQPHEVRVWADSSAAWCVKAG